MEMLEYQEKMQTYDEMLKDSELTENDVMQLDAKVKDGIHKRTKASLK